jgi:hypothetical protein
LIQKRFTSNDQSGDIRDRRFPLVFAIQEVKKKKFFSVGITTFILVSVNHRSGHRSESNSLVPAMARPQGGSVLRDGSLTTPSAITTKLR